MQIVPRLGLPIVGRSRKSIDPISSPAAGKSLLLIGNYVKPQNKKYFAFPEVKIMALIRPSRPTRGAFRDRHDALGGAAVDALASGMFFMPDENARAYGEVVWSWRRDAGAKLLRSQASQG